MNLYNKFKALGEGSVHLKNETGVSIGILSQGRSSTKIVGGGKIWKNVNHYGWPTKKSLGFEYSLEQRKWLWNFCFFSWNIFKNIQGFSCLSR